jgi:hypothetical protein
MIFQKRWCEGGANGKPIMEKTNNFSSEEGVSLKEYINDKLNNLEKSVDMRFHAVNTSTNQALATADKATSKAETATEKRFEGVNEFRAALSDQARTFVIRSEFSLAVDRLEQDIKNLASARMDLVDKESYKTTMVGLEARVDDLRLSRANLEGKASATSVYIAYLFSAIGTIMGVLGLLL